MKNRGYDGNITCEKREEKLDFRTCHNPMGVVALRMEAHIVGCGCEERGMERSMVNKRPQPQRICGNKSECINYITFL